MTQDRRQDRHFRDTVVDDQDITITVNPIGVDSWGEFIDGDTTPDIGSGSFWKTANTAPTTITNFDNPKDNIHEITILITEAFTTIQNNANVVLQDGSDFAGAVDKMLTLVYDGNNWVELAPGPSGGGGATDHGALTGLGDDDHPQYHNDARGDARYKDHGGLSGLSDDDHLQYMLTLTGADMGDIPYVNASGRLDYLPAELGNGFLVLNSRGPGLTPVWLDVLTLIQFITGGENVSALGLFSVIMTSISGSGVVDNSGAAASGSGSLSVILTTVSGSGVASSDTPASGSGAVSVPILGISGSGVVIP